MCMIFVIISILVPVLLIALLPRVLLRLGANFVQRDWLLYVACTLFFVSWYLPSPIIDGQNTQFMTHFVGGGLFSGGIWLFMKRAFQWKRVWWFEAASLYALVSSLGVANELFEWLIVQMGFIRFSLADTSWDLVANTLGALCFWLVYQSAQMVKSR